MWGRVVTYVGHYSQWQPMYALRVRDDGPMQSDPAAFTVADRPILFENLKAATDWAREHQWTHVLCDQLLGWKG